MTAPTTGVTVERFRVTVLSVPLSDPVEMSFSSLRDRRVCLVEVEADGMVGTGESWINYPSWAAQERLATLCDGVAPLLLGAEVSDPDRTQQQLARQLLPLGRQWGAVGPIWQAISGVDLALWDLLGKVSGRPAAALLAGSPPPAGSVPAYGSGVGPDQVAALTERSLQQGLRAVKTKIGFGRERDQQTLADARAVLGDGHRLLTDANQAWDLAEARRMCEVLRRYEVGWLEEPLAGNDLAALEKLAAETSLALATGENVYGAGDFDRYVASTAVGVIQPDLSKSGGLTMGAHVARRAARSGTQVAPHCYGGAVGIAASLQLAAAFPAVTWVELDVRPNPLRTDLLTRAPELRDGRLLVPPGPGLGVEVDPDAVARYRLHQEERAHRRPRPTPPPAPHRRSGGQAP